MRLPVNSCPGCSMGAAITESGLHLVGSGKQNRCAFVKAELESFPGVEFVAVYEGWEKGKARAERHAERTGGALIWSGQGPHHLWLVVKEKPCTCTENPESVLNCARHARGPEPLATYRKLADGLSDMVEGGRLREADIPDDYQWLVATLAKIAGLDPKQ